MTSKELKGKACVYRPLYQDKLVEAVIDDLVVYEQLDGTATDYAVLSNGDHVALSTLMFKASSRVNPMSIVCPHCEAVGILTASIKPGLATFKSWLAGERQVADCRVCDRSFLYVPSVTVTVLDPESRPGNSNV